MRIEGFLSLMGCVMLLFVLCFGLGALFCELRILVPDAAIVTAKAPSPSPPSR